MLAVTLAGEGESGQWTGRRRKGRGREDEEGGVGEWRKGTGGIEMKGMI